MDDKSELADDEEEDMGPRSPKEARKNMTVANTDIASAFQRRNALTRKLVIDTEETFKTVLQSNQAEWLKKS